MYLVVIFLFGFTVFIGALMGLAVNHGRNEQAQLSIFSAFILVLVLAFIVTLALML